MEIRMKKILCAMDFSAFTPQMLHYGVGLSKSLGATLLVFHSVHVPEDELYATHLPQRSGELKEKAAKALEKIEEIMAPYRVDWLPVAAEGDPVETVSEAAEREDVDLVVAVSHGISGLKRLMIGTVVERMARGLKKRPFLVIRPSKKVPVFETNAALSLEKVVVGCDLSREITPALEYARFFGDRFDAEIHLLHSVESPMREYEENAGGGRYGEVQQRLLERLRERLLDTFPGGVEEGPRIRAAVDTGVPSEALMRHAKRHAADLMIVGIRRHGTIEKLLAGSTTEAVIRHSPCPVLVVSPGVDPDE